MGQLDHGVDLLLVFLGTPVLSSQTIRVTCIPTDCGVFARVSGVSVCNRHSDWNERIPYGEFSLWLTIYFLQEIVGHLFSSHEMATQIILSTYDYDWLDLSLVY